MLSFIAGGPPEPQYLAEIIPMICFILIAFIGDILAARRPEQWQLRGGIMMMGASFLMMALLIILKGWDVIRGALMYGLPFLIAGLLFFIDCKISEKNMGKKQDEEKIE